ncbi:MAG: hypothetical protein NUV98_06910 [Candidatus Roizmanbacteria bacterium]|nr:hypothetical protein [Candidatus Roizmanbacteria bacterium]
MKCPICKKQPISKIGFILKSTPQDITCTHCGTRLKFGPLLRRTYYIGLSVASLFGISVALIGIEYDWGLARTLLVILGVTAPLGVFMEYYLWNHGKFELRAR